MGGWFTDDTPKRFEAYGWQVIRNVDGHDPAAVAAAIEEARADGGRPSLICCKTIIGYGAPNKQGKESCHGAPLGEEEIALARRRLGWHHPPFEIPQEIYGQWNARERGAAWEGEWRQLMEGYRQQYPAEAAELERRLAGKLPEDFAARAQAFVEAVAAEGPSIASRKASQKALEGYGPLLPELIGGSADLAGSNLTIWSGSRPLSRQHGDGNYIFFGVREFGMAAIANGLALHGGFLPYCATFLIFSEYARNALRMAALMKLRAVFVFTHDSIGLGEDGPTHQAVEQAATLRLIPNMSVWRPCDAVESAVAWKQAIERTDGPTCLLFSRQTLPHQERTSLAEIERGGYVLRDCEGEPEAIIIATGSEVGLAVSAAAELGRRGRRVRVVSMPSVDVFEAQEAAYRDAVLPPAVRCRVVVEAGATGLWHRYAGDRGTVIGLDRFGESAPGPVLFEHFGITSERVVDAVEALLAD